MVLFFTGIRALLYYYFEALDLESGRFFFFFILEAVQLWRDVKFHAPFGLRTRHDLRGACTLQSAE